MEGGVGVMANSKLNSKMDKNGRERRACSSLMYNFLAIDKSGRSFRINELFIESGRFRTDRCEFDVNLNQLGLDDSEAIGSVVTDQAAVG